MSSDRRDSSKGPIRTDDAYRPDSIKDTRRNDLSIFLDNQTLKTSPFGDNLSGEHVYRRAERIASAIHLITRHVNVNEPVRASARSESLRLLDIALELRNELRATSSQNVREMQVSIRKLISLLRILGISGRVSFQNTQILVDALDELGNLIITAQRSVLAEAIQLSRDDLIPHVQSIEPRIIHRTFGTLQKGDRRRVTDADIHSDESTEGGMIKDKKKKDKTGEPRTGRIMDILRGGGLLGIKDIVSNLPEYSEKMIQRDLALLVNQNQVKKIGAKRWSRYTIVQ